MIRSIDFMFALPEFRSFLNQIDGFQAAPFYHLLRINGNPSIPNLETDARRRLSYLIVHVSDDEQRLNLGRLYFLTFLAGSGFIAQKLLSTCDEDFVVTFIAGALTTEPEERMVKLLDQSRMLDDGIMDYFRKITDTLTDLRRGPCENENNRRDFLISTNEFITISITDPDRLFDISLFNFFVEKQGGSKSWVTKHVIDGYQQYQRIKEILTEIDQGKERQIPCFGTLAVYGLLLGLSCSLCFELDRGTKIVVLSLPFFLDLLYGHNQLLTVEECFAIWLTNNGVQASQIKNISSYPFGVNISYAKSLEQTDEEAETNLVLFLSKRFGQFYDLAVILMRLLAHNTNFNLTKYNDLQHWKSSYKLVIQEDNLEILPIMDAVNEQMKYPEEELRFRAPIVPWDSRMGIFGSNPAWPKYFLKKVNNLSPEGKGIIQSVFFDRISLPFEDYFGRQSRRNIYILKSRQEMLDKVGELSDAEMKFLKDVDFLAYLDSIGYPDMNLPTDEYAGEKGLRKSILQHSLIHLRFGLKDDLTWPKYFPAILE